jgi:2-keto-4-pentenoate hydratase/2-oxohepta-3-ene-1,7-dioic acid hydratase in catechol pathway
MRLVTFSDANGAERAGAILPAESGRLLDLAEAWRLSGAPGPAPLSLQALIESGPFSWDRVRELLAAPPAEAVRTLAGVRVLAPLPRPIRMRDFSVFESHAALDGRIKLADVWYEWPVYYKCNTLSVVGPDATVAWPAGSHEIDYELEFAAVIGNGGKGISRARASEHIFGYTIFNDLSARDWQLKEMAAGLGPARGKDFDGSNVLGPVLVTADEIADPYDLAMVARVNGEEWSRGSTSGMRHRFDAIIEFLSEAETLHPGEILGSGTVGGGCGLELGRFLNRGDVVELEVDALGLLRTRIA